MKKFIIKYLKPINILINVIIGIIIGIIPDILFSINISNKCIILIICGILLIILILIESKLPTSIPKISSDSRFILYKDLLHELSVARDDSNKILNTLGYYPKDKDKRYAMIKSNGNNFYNSLSSLKKIFNQDKAFLQNNFVASFNEIIDLMTKLRYIYIYILRYVDADTRKYSFKLQPIVQKYHDLINKKSNKLTGDINNYMKKYLNN